jgi:hypothetical protein
MNIFKSVFFKIKIYEFVTVEEHDHSHDILTNLIFYSGRHFFCGMVLHNFYARSLLVCFYIAHNLKLRLVSEVVLIPRRQALHRDCERTAPSTTLTTPGTPMAAPGLKWISWTLQHQGREIIAIVPLENGAFCTIFSENFHKF